MSDSQIGFAPSEFLLAQNAICVIEIGGSPSGTGVLIGPDLVLTNHHVASLFIAGSARGACRFDYQQFKNKIEPGWATPIVECLAWRPAAAGDAAGDIKAATQLELDYAVLRLAPHPSLPLVRLQPRHFIAIPSRPRAPERGEPIMVAGHPMSLVPNGLALAPVRTTQGQIMEVSPYRVTHTAETLRGSSGSACLDSGLELLALHQAGDARGTRLPSQRAIPILCIRDDIRSCWPAVAAQILGAASAEAAAAPIIVATDVAEEKILESRVNAAHILMDREEATKLFHDSRFNRVGVQRNDAPLVHFFISREGGETGWLMNRLAHLVRTEKAGGAVYTSWVDLLRKPPGKSESDWILIPSKWPSSIGSDAKRLASLNIDDSQQIAQKRFFHFSKNIDGSFEPTREKALIAAFAQKCADAPGVGANSFQAAIVFTVCDAASEARLGQFAQMWDYGAAPPYCGLCEMLDDIAADDLSEWQGLLARAWQLDGNRLGRDIDSLFRASTRSPLGVVAERLRGPLGNYVKEYLARS